VSALQRLARNFSIEITPREAGRFPGLANVLPPGTEVYVTFIPRDGLAGLISAAARLSREGMVPVPHICARDLESLNQLEAALRRLTGESGVRRALVIAGSRTSPSGPFGQTLDLLRTGVFHRCGITAIGVAGHPEGNAGLSAAALLDVLAEKAAWARETGTAMHVLTQFGFDAEPVKAWEARLRGAGLRLPVRIGLHGVTSVARLIKYGVSCGIGASLRFLRQRAVVRADALHSPAELMAEFARYQDENPDSLFERFHFFPLGGFEPTARLARAAATSLEEGTR
jgi:methylenetetrahydrofolate reductase (NADPH)